MPIRLPETIVTKPICNMTALQRGVTLLEVIIVVTILGILAGLAVPSYQDMIERNRLKEVIDGFKSDMQFARTMAIKRSSNVVVSRSTGNLGAWCYGLNYANSCTCTTAGSCGIKTVTGNQFSTTINMATDDTNSTFDFRRGTVGATNTTFSTNRYTARLVFSNTGRVRICTPSGTTGLPGYPIC